MAEQIHGTHGDLKRRDLGAPTTGARFIAETLKGYGITHVFFMEGILRRSLVEMEALGIRRVLAHSEKGAAYMADGYARIGRKPAVCMSQSVGAANLAAGLQDPFLGLSPVIAVTGRKDLNYQYRNAYQEVPHGPLFEAITKFNVQVETGDQLPFLLRQAFREATSGAPGPVHLDVLGHVGQTTDAWEVKGEVVVEKPFTRCPAYRPEPEKELVQEAAGLLERSDRPVIVVGGGALMSSAGPEIQELAETLSIPVASSLGGKGAMTDTHPLCLGVMGSYSRWCANKAVSEADLVLFVGSRTGDLVTNDWTVPRQGTQVIQVDIDPLELGRSYPNAVGLQGDAKVTLRRILEAVDHKAKKEDWAGHVRGYVEEWRKEMDPLMQSEAVPILPNRLCREISDVLPEDGIIVSDTGFSAIWSGLLIHLTHPGQRYIRAAGSLGWGLPASLGAKCAAPDRPVICFTGDGGFLYHMSELETAVRCGIHTVTVVNNNHGLGQCRKGVRKAYGDRPGRREELCEFGRTDFAQIAMDLGCVGIRIERPQEIAQALRKAFEADLPAVVDVITDEESEAPWTPSY